MRRIALGVLVSVAAPGVGLAQSPAPAAVRMVEVAPEVRLEVVDWGGTGPAMVFLAGLGNTAHVFEEFAPRFRDSFHVYGITRRGFGASSCTESGYDAETRARDIVAVLDTLGIDRAVLVGHSIAGDELSRIGAEYPRRVRALVFLEAYEYGPEFAEMSRRLRTPPQASPAPTHDDSASLRSASAYERRLLGVTLPDAEIRATVRFDPDGHVARAPARPCGAAPKVIAGTEPADYARITAPALAVYGGRVTPRSLHPLYATFDAANRALARQVAAAVGRWNDQVRRRFRREMRRATVVDVRGGRHYVFITHPDCVEQAMRAFLRRIR
jgi:pimeloyl-ACP methyl ester carboxylesterase